MVSRFQYYYMDLGVAWTIRIILVVGLCAIFALTGCSSSSDRSRSLEADLSVKGSYTPGPDASTRNQTPQGGTDEKSDRTPIEPAK